MKRNDVNAPELRPSESAARLPDEGGHLQEQESRALVVIAAAEHPVHAKGYHYAPFLAQLVATKDGHPQTRERRRAEPVEVLAAYRAAVSRA